MCLFFRAATFCLVFWSMLQLSSLCIYKTVEILRRLHFLMACCMGKKYVKCYGKSVNVARGSGLGASNHQLIWFECMNWYWFWLSWILYTLIYDYQCLLNPQIERARGIECLWNRRVDQTIFENHSGVENLQELYLTDMKGIKGTVLSSAITNFSFLSKLVLKQCNFLSQ